MARYNAACKQADSIRACAGTDCQVIAGQNDGYYIEAFGLSYRFASINDAVTIAKLFVDIVSMGPIETIS